MIRDAIEGDFPEILDMCEQFWSHTIYTEAFDREHTAGMVQMAFDHKLLLVVDIKGRACGFLAAIKAPLLASRESSHAVELAYWINPECRRGGDAINLMRAIEDRARAVDVKYFNFVALESSEPKKAERIYNHMGYEKSETSYTKVI